MTRALLLVVLSSAVASAVPKGGSLYVAHPEAVMRDAPSMKGKVVLTLKRGDALTWLGPSDKDKSFHLVEREGKKGFVHMGDLSPVKAQEEVSTPAQPPQPVPFAQSGAATKSPSLSKENEETLRSLEALEALNATVATPDALAKKRKELAR